MLNESPWWTCDPDACGSSDSLPLPERDRPFSNIARGERAEVKEEMKKANWKRDFGGRALPREI